MLHKPLYKATADNEGSSQGLASLATYGNALEGTLLVLQEKIILYSL